MPDLLSAHTRIALSRLAARPLPDVRADDAFLHCDGEHRPRWIDICAELARHRPDRLDDLLRMPDHDAEGRPLPRTQARWVARLARAWARGGPVAGVAPAGLGYADRLLLESFETAATYQGELPAGLADAPHFTLEVPLMLVRWTDGRRVEEGVLARVTAWAVPADGAGGTGWQLAPAPGSTLLQMTPEFEQTLQHAARVARHVVERHAQGPAPAAPNFVWDIRLPGQQPAPLSGESAGAALALVLMGAMPDATVPASLQPALAGLRAALPVVSARLTDGEGRLGSIGGLGVKIDAAHPGRARGPFIVARDQAQVAGARRPRFASLGDLLAWLATEGASRATAAAERYLRPYLHWVATKHGALELPSALLDDGEPLPLDQVFVALRGTRATSHEMEQRRLLLLERERREALDTGNGPKGGASTVRVRALRRDRQTRSLADRDRTAGAGDGARNLATAFRDERWMVILGDPGSGKTTLARWLAATLAVALQTRTGARDRRTEVTVPTRQVDPHSPLDDRPVSLGPARLPVFLRVASFAKALAAARESGRTLALIDFLCELEWRGPPDAEGERIPTEALDALFRLYLGNGQAVIILDGLDEITNAIDRQVVVHAVEEFAREWIPPGRAAPAGAGNQLVVTSRILGYGFAPLRLQGMSQMTIVPMQQEAVESFCEAWMRAAEARAPGSETPPEREARANALADGLVRAVYDNPRARARELATNPLLLTILATLYRRNGGQLADTRVEIYESIVGILVSKWPETADFQPGEAMSVLPPLAAHIHERDATGYIEEGELASLLRQELARVRRVDAASPALQDNVDALVVSLANQVGLITQRAEGVYAFLHLSLQEYLAGVHMAGDFGAAAASGLVAHLGNPRWREPVLMAIGHVLLKADSRQRPRFVRQLLESDRHAGPTLPLAALAVAESLVDATRLGDSAVYGELVERLLAALADPELRTRPPALVNRIQRALLRLRHVDAAGWMDEVLAGVLRRGEGALAAATAECVRNNEWYTQPLVDALAAGLAKDQAAWDWPFERALRDIVSPELAVPMPGASAPDADVRRIDSELRALARQPGTPEGAARRAELLQERDAATRKLLDLKANQPQEYARLVARHALAAAALEAHGLRMQLRSRRGRLPPGLRLRGVLERGPDALAAMLADHRLLAMVVAVNGGIADHRADAVDREYHGLVRFLEKSDTEREFLMDRDPRPVVQRFGTGDPIYAAATYLDSRMLGRLDATKALVVFTPAAMYRSSAIDGAVQQVLEGDLDLQGLKGALRRCWRQGPDLRARADAVTALVAMGVDVTPDLRRDLQDPALRADAGAILRQLERTRALLGDAVRRARWTVVMNGLASLNTVDSETWADTVEPVLETLCAYSDTSLRFDVVKREGGAVRWDIYLHGVAPATQTPLVIADALLALLGSIPDRHENLATAVSCMPPGPLLAEALQHLHRAPNQRCAASPVRWVVEPLPPVALAGAGNPPAPALQALACLDPESLPIGSDGPFFDQAIRSLIACTGGRRDACMELMLVALRLRAYAVAAELAVALAVQQEPGPLDRLLWALQLRDTIDGQPEPAELMRRLHIEHARAMVAGLRGADAKARVWLAALPLLGPERDAAMAEARAAAGKVRDAATREWLLEQLMAWCAVDVLPDLHEAACDAARAIRDPDTQSRAWARLARLAPIGEQEALWCRALEAARRIPHEPDRAATLALFRPLRPTGARVDAAWAEAVVSLATPRASARAQGMLALQLLREPPEAVGALIEAAPASWAPVLLAGALGEVLAAFPRDPAMDERWAALATQPHDQRLLHELADLALEEGAVLTRQAAEAVDALAAAGQDEALTLLMPLLQSPVPAAAPMLARWKAGSRSTLAQHAVLMQMEAEQRILNHDVSPLVELLERGPDRSQMRAQIALWSRVWNLSTAQPRLRISRLDAAVVESIHRHSHDVADAHPRRLHGMTTNLLHDDGDALARWVAACEGRGAMARTACVIVHLVFHVDDATWTTYLDLMARAGPKAAVELVESACLQATVKDHLPPERLAQLLSRLRTMDQPSLAAEWVLLEPERVFVDAALQVAAEGSADPVGALRARVTAASTNLQALCRDLSDDGLLTALQQLGNQLVIDLGGRDPTAERHGDRAAAEGPALELLVRWLHHSLTEAEPTSRWMHETGTLLRVVANAAERSPSIYARAVQGLGIEPLLAREVMHQSKTLAAMGALRLLSGTQLADAATVQAFLGALQGERPLQDAAIGAIGRLVDFSNEGLSVMTAALEDSSAVVAHGAALMLVAVCRNERIEPARRDAVLHSLATAAARPLSRRGVYRFGGLGADSQRPANIICAGRLDHLLNDARLRIIGVADEA